MGVLPTRLSGDAVRCTCVMLLLRFKASIGVVFELALRGRAVPVVLLLRSAEPGRLMEEPAEVAVVEDDATVAALSLRTLSTCSIEGRGLFVRLFDRTIGRGRIGELYSSDGSTLAGVTGYDGCAAETLGIGAGAAEAGLGCGCCMEKLSMAGVSKLTACVV